MALREIRVPHLETYNFGVGVDRHADAESDLAAHGHGAAFIAVCSDATGQCGPVQRADQ